MKYNINLLKGLILAGFIMTAINTVYADIKQGLIADFPFSNGLIEDVSGNNYLASGFGDLTPTEGHFGEADTNSAYNFNGGFIQTNIDGQQITDAMSVSFWLKTSHDCFRDLLNYCRWDRAAFIFSTSSTEETGHYYKYVYNNNYTDDLSVVINLHDNEWHHIALTFNQEYTTMYVDGIYQDRKEVDSFSFSGDVFKFGKEKSTSSAYFRGNLDNIKIYNRVLASNDIFALFKENKSAPVAAMPLSPKKTKTPTYIWNAVSNSSWYYLWVNDSSGNKVKKWYTATQANCTNGTGICSITPNTPLENGSAVWWVRTWNDFGFGSWTSSTYFNVSD